MTAFLTSFTRRHARNGWLRRRFTWPSRFTPVGHQFPARKRHGSSNDHSGSRASGSGVSHIHAVTLNHFVTCDATLASHGQLVTANPGDIMLLSCWLAVGEPCVRLARIQPRSLSTRSTVGHHEPRGISFSDGRDVRHSASILAQPFALQAAFVSGGRFSA